jgi:hypothetical protein
MHYFREIRRNHFGDPDGRIILKQVLEDIG